MATTLAEIRAKLQAAENRGTNGSMSTGESSIYAHWNIAEGTSAKIRFLPDGDSQNTFFWIERAMIKLPFVGVEGQDDSRPVIVQVPCMEMYGKDTPCPILADVRTWFKDPSLEDMGRKYWKKKSYLFQGFIRENPLSDDKAPENPIRRLIISPQIFNLVKSALMDPELENLPTDFDAGLDFTVTKTSKGGYSDYSTSKWARKESSLTANEHAAIEKFGLFNLSEFLPKKPTEVELKVIKEMFEASVNGKEYDPTRWGQYFKPIGMNIGSTNESSNGASSGASETVPQKEVPVLVVANDTNDINDVDPVVAPVADKSSSQRAEDILAMIRSRQKQ